MSDIKQYIIIRKDLNMSTGKIAAQASHASMKVFFDRMSTIREESGTNYEFLASDDEVEWINGMFTKVVLGVKNEGQLLKVYQLALEAGLNVSLIKDAGLTELVGANFTAVAIGPNKISECYPIVSKLRLL